MSLWLRVKVLSNGVSTEGLSSLMISIMSIHLASNTDKNGHGGKSASMPLLPDIVLFPFIMGHNNHRKF
jgi:hypothetical protein